MDAGYHVIASLLLILVNGTSHDSLAKCSFLEQHDGLACKCGKALAGWSSEIHGLPRDTARRYGVHLYLENYQAE